MAEATRARAQPTTLGRVRLLGHDDLAATVRILTADPVANVFVASRIRAAGLDPNTLGCPVWGYEFDGVLRSVCHAGSNLVPVGADINAVAAYCEFAGSQRTCSSIIGPSGIALELWHRLSERWGSPWSQVREVRPRQPVMAIAADPVIDVDPRLKRITMEHWDPYYEAAVKMYTEEVGVSPVQGNSAGYRFYIGQLIRQGRAYGVIENGRVIFKADLGSVSATVSQIQGVWLDPALRGRGLAAPAMAGVVRYARMITPTVSLYVNDFNVRARATYERVGLETVGEFATILY